MSHEDRPQQRGAAVARRAGTILGSALVIVALNITGVGALPLENARTGDLDASRSQSLSRSTDRFQLQDPIHVGDSDEPFLPFYEPEARPAPSQDAGAARSQDAVCISSPIAPGRYRISSKQGMRRHPITGLLTLHAGVDLAAPMTTPIHAVADGVVVYTGRGKAGRSSELVIIDHNVDGVRFSSWYVHMYPSGVFVEADQNVRAGEIIAEVGSNGNSTGPHLHFEIHTLPAISGGVGTHVTPRLAATPDAPEGPSQSPSETSTPEEPSPEPKESESPDPPSTDPDEPEETDAHLEDDGGDDDEGDVKEERTDEESVSDAEGTHEAVKVDDDVLDEKGSGEGIDDLEEFTSQSTGYFDPSSFGVLHDPLPFLLELGFGIVAPSVCLDR